MDIWDKYYKQSSLGSPSTFQKAFLNLNNEQLSALRAKFDALIDKSALPHEFAATIAMASMVQGNPLYKINKTEDNFLKLMSSVDETQLQFRIRQLLAVFYDMDSYNQNQISWQQFSQAVQNMSSTESISGTKTLYNAHQQYIQLLSSKITDPIQNIGYCKHPSAFAALCKDNTIYMLSDGGQILKPLKNGHSSLPLSCCSVYPYVPGLAEMYAEAWQQTLQTVTLPGQKTAAELLMQQLCHFNYISSGADRRLIVWNVNQVPVSYITTYNIITNLASLDQVIYRGQIVQPALFGGDDAGNVHFYQFEDQKFKPILNREKNLQSFSEQEELLLDAGAFLDDDLIEESDDAPEEDAEFSEAAENMTGSAFMRDQKAKNVDEEALRRRQKRFERQRRLQDIQQKLQHAQNVAKLSPTPIWTCKAHNAWNSCLSVEHMRDSDDYLLVSGGTDGSLVRIDIDAGAVCTRYVAHTGPVSGTAWLHNRGLMISVGKDRQLNLWPANVTQAQVTPIAQVLKSEQQYVGVYAARDSQDFFTVDVTGTITQWDVRKLQPVNTIVGNQSRNGKCVAASFSSQSGSIAVGTSVIGLAKRQNSSQQTHICQNSVQCLSLSQTSPGCLLVADNGIQAWDLLRGCRTRDFEELLKTTDESHNLGQVLGQISNSEQLGPNVLQAMSAPYSSDKYGQIQLKDFTGEDTGAPEIEDSEQGGIFVEKQVSALALSPNNQLFAVGTEDGGVSVYQTLTGLELFTVGSGEPDTGDFPQKFHESLKELQNQKALIEKEKSKLTSSPPKESAVLRESAKDARALGTLMTASRGPCSGLFFGVSQGRLSLWIAYLQTQTVACYLLRDAQGQKYTSVGRYMSKNPWHGLSFIEQLNVLILYESTEFTAIQQDGGVLCRCSIVQDVQKKKKAITYAQKELLSGETSNKENQSNQSRASRPQTGDANAELSEGKLSEKSRTTSEQQNGQQGTENAKPVLPGLQSAQKTPLQEQTQIIILSVLRVEHVVCLTLFRRFDGTTILYFLDSRTFSAFAWVELPLRAPGGQSTISAVSVSISNSSALIYQEDGTLSFFKIEGLHEATVAYGALLLPVPQQDCKLQLSIQGGLVSSIYNTRRPYMNVLELQEPFKQQYEKKLQEISQSQTENQYFRKFQNLPQPNTPIELKSSAELKYNSVECDGQMRRISELCPLQLHATEHAGLFLFTTGLGYVMAVDQATGEFLQFLSLGGWSAQNRHKIRKALIKAPLTCAQESASAASREAERRAIRFSQFLSQEAAYNAGKEKKSVQQLKNVSDREKINVTNISKLMQQEYFQTNKNQLSVNSSTKEVLYVKEVGEKLQQMKTQVQESYLSASHMSMSKKLSEPIDKKNARERLATALSRLDEAGMRSRLTLRGALSTLPRAPSPNPRQRPVSVLGAIGASNDVNVTSAQSDRPARTQQLRPAPSILTMAPADISVTFGEEASRKFKPSSVLKKPTKVFWDTSND